MDFALLLLGSFVFCLFPKSYAEDSRTLEFSSLNKVPQSLLDKLQNPKENKNAGTDNPNIETYTFTSFSQVPQSLLDELTSSEIQNLKDELSKDRSVSGELDFEIPGQQPAQPKTTTAKTTTPAAATNNQNTRTFTITSLSQIPESVYEELSSSEIEQLKEELGNQGKGPKEFDFTIGGGQGTTPAATNTNQQSQNDTYVITSISQIPESLYEELSSSEIEDLKYELSHGGSGPQTFTYEITTRGKKPSKPNNLYYIRYGDSGSSINSDSETISRISEIPESQLKLIPKYEIKEIKRTLDDYKNIFHHYDISKFGVREINNLITVIMNYINAGGYLTGIPPVDLLLLRIYLRNDPKKFCYSQ